MPLLMIYAAPAAALSFITGHLRRTLGSFFDAEQVQWCLKVPAMWSDAAKAKMRQAAHRAGITGSVDSDALVIALEPEAAALYARHEEGGPFSLPEGHTFMVVDAGGGTVDITVHEVVSRGGQLALAEVAAGTGALFGATYVDETFMAHFRDVVSGS